MYDGIEVDVLNIGDADCIIVTQWSSGFPHRVMIDGGCASDAEKVLNFLVQRNYTVLWAVVCSHLHNDHASGLIKVVEHRRITICHGYMHDIRKHVQPEILRRAMSSDTGVDQVVKATEKLANAFATRGITPLEPFVGQRIAYCPDMVVLTPSERFYRDVICEFTKRDVIPMPSLYSGMLAAGIAPYSTTHPLAGMLSSASVKEKPKTQPYNNTSVVLGVRHGNAKLLFTADAGCSALAHVSSDWNHLDYCGVPHHASEGNFSQTEIERFCPEFAFISAKGDDCHPSRAVVSALVKVGSKVASTHKSGDLWYHIGNVPPRADYGPLEYLTGTGSPEPIYNWINPLGGLK